MKAGIFDMPFKEYLADPCPEPALSASVIKTMLQKSPMHAADEHPRLGNNKEEKEDSKVSRIGTVGHAIITKQTDHRIALSPYEEFRSNEAKAWKQDALASGKIVIKPEEYETASKMSDSFFKNFSKNFGKVKEEFPSADFEKTIIVQMAGVWCKIRVDAIAESLWDLKSTGTEYTPEKWCKNQLEGMGYDITAAFYRRVYQELTGEHKRYIFAVLEQKSPFDSYPVIPTTDMLALADEKIDWALKTWRRGLDTGKWDGYARGEIIFASASPWNITAWEQFKELEKTREQIESRKAA
jgi:hypothetical protein